MRFHALAGAALLLVATPAFSGSQTSTQYLVPVTNFGRYFAYTELVTEYPVYKKGEDGLLQFVEYPTGEPIISTSILDYESDGHRSYRVVSVSAPVPLTAKTKASELTVRSVPISADTVGGLSKIYEWMLLDTHYPQVGPFIAGTDGAEYQFYLANGDMAGEAWTPARDTPVGVLVDVSLALRRYTQGEISAEALSAKIDEAMAWLKAHRHSHIQPD
jgi:hypothetical protein